MGILPPEMIYKIASYIKSEKDIMALAEVFPNFRFKFSSSRPVDYERYQTLKDKFIVEKIIYKGNDMITFPNNLKFLQFYRYFNAPISLPLPEKLEYLCFGSGFDQPVDGLLPMKLKKLIFLGSFDKSVDKLPPNLQEINFSDKFNHPVNHLPKTLKILWLRESFRQSLENLPDSIESLYLMCHYPQKITKLSANIKKFRTWTRFDRDYTGEREFDYLKEKYPELTIKYYFKRRFGVIEEIIM
jgi:hypothetical protein